MAPKPSKFTTVARGRQRARSRACGRKEGSCLNSCFLGFGVCSGFLRVGFKGLRVGGLGVLVFRGWLGPDLLRLRLIQGLGMHCPVHGKKLAQVGQELAG